MKVNLTLTSTGQKVDNYSLPKFFVFSFFQSRPWWKGIAHLKLPN